MDRVYLDNNATTIVDPAVSQAMEPFHCRYYGNPNSLHSFGREVHPYLHLALDRLYAGLGASDEDDVIPLSCATEANNAVLKSVYFDRILKGNKKRIIISQIEHPSVSKTAEYLESLGVEVIALPVNEEGIVTPESLKHYLNPDITALVSVM
jgi:cysteine desulfurase